MRKNYLDVDFLKELNVFQYCDIEFHLSPVFYLLIGYTRCIIVNRINYKTVQ